MYLRRDGDRVPVVPHGCIRVLWCQAPHGCIWKGPGERIPACLCGWAEEGDEEEGDEEADGPNYDAADDEEYAALFEEGDGNDEEARSRAISELRQLTRGQDYYDGRD